MKNSVQAARPIGNENFLYLKYQLEEKEFTFKEVNLPDWYRKRKGYTPPKKRFVKDIESGEALKINYYRVDRIQMAQKTDGVCLILITYKYEEEKKKKPIKAKKGKKKKGAKGDEELAVPAEEKVIRDEYYTLI